MQVTEQQAQELFQFLRPDKVTILNHSAEPVSFKAGETVYDEGSKAHSMYVVISGKVALLKPGADGVHVRVNEIGEGQLFGVCVCLGIDAYTTTAQCAEDAWLLRVDADVLKRLMDEDCTMGYALQTQIARIYFGRYANAMRRLGAIVTNASVEPACDC
jgi:CRP-like cAMP-binding protein